MFKKLVAKGTGSPIKKPLIIAAQMLDLDPRILHAELTSRGIDTDPPIEEGNLGTKNRRPDRGQPRGLNYTNTMGVIRTLGKSNDYDIVKSHGISDGMVALIRDANGDAYEVTVKPSYYGSFFDRERGVVEMNEAEYPGSIGFEEVVKFHQNASPQAIDHFNSLLDAGKSDEAWHVVHSTSPSQHDLEEDIHEDYATMKSKPNDYLDGDEFVG
jgi:hypothetical protein